MKKLLYLFDDINYESGAQKAMLYQIEMLKEQYQITIFSLKEPKTVKLPESVLILGKNIWEIGSALSTEFKETMKSNQFSIIVKLKRLLYTIAIRISLEEQYLEKVLYYPLRKEFETFDTIIVISESSKLRSFVAKLNNPKKIQWIHTDYEQWSNFSSWTRLITKKDKQIYAKFDCIVTLSEQCKKDMLKKLPNLEDKIIVIPNLIDGKRILFLSEQETIVSVDTSKFCFVSVGRLEAEKAFDRVIELCIRLKQEKRQFRWYLIGDGSKKQIIQQSISKYQLEKEVILTGYLKNPYPVMKKCNCFVLLSNYEGRPITIDEAMVLGLSVIAVDVGGVREQLLEWKRGTVIPFKKDKIYEKINNCFFKCEGPIEKISYEEFNLQIKTKLIQYL